MDGVTRPQSSLKYKLKDAQGQIFTQACEVYGIGVEEALRNLVKDDTLCDEWISDANNQALEFTDSDGLPHFYNSDKPSNEFKLNIILEKLKDHLSDEQKDVSLGAALNYAMNN